MLVREGAPLIDLLEGGAIGRGGGVARHQVEAQAGLTRNGLGLRLSATWTGGSRVDAASGRSEDRLRFGDLMTANLRLFANFGAMPELVVANPWLRGTRVTLAMDNLFNQRQRVTDASGATPMNFQPALLDPLGRTVRLEVRKLFFALPPRRAIDPPPPRGQDEPRVRP